MKYIVSSIKCVLCQSDILELRVLCLHRGFVDYCSFKALDYDLSLSFAIVECKFLHRLNVRFELPATSRLSEKHLR